MKNFSDNIKLFQIQNIQKFNINLFLFCIVSIFKKYNQTLFTAHQELSNLLTFRKSQESGIRDENIHSSGKESHASSHTEARSMKIMRGSNNIPLGVRKIKIKFCIPRVGMRNVPCLFLVTLLCKLCNGDPPPSLTLKIRARPVASLPLTQRAY